MRLLALTLLALLAEAVEPPSLRSCTSIALGSVAASQSQLDEDVTCFRMEEDRVTMQQDLEIVGRADGSTVWDMEWRAGGLDLGGHMLKLANITIARTLLMWMPPRELVPMFMDVHTEGSSISLENVTLHMIGRCDILQKVSDGFNDVAVTSAKGSSLFIPFSSEGVARGSSITVQCDVDGEAPGQISLAILDGSHLLTGLSTFQQTRLEEATFHVAAANISLQDANWPDDSDDLPEVFDHLLVQGSQLLSPVGRLPVLDFGLLPQVMRIERGDAQVKFQGLILTNMLMEKWTNAAARDPLALFSLSFHGFQMARSTGEHLIVQDCTIVVSELEKKAFTYWGIMSNTEGTPHIHKAAPQVQDLRLDRIIIYPKGDGTLLIWELTNYRAVTFRNVTLTTEYPELAPPRLQPADQGWGDSAPAIYTTEHLPLVEVRNGSTFLQALLDTSRDREFLEDPRVLLATPRILYLTADVIIQRQPGDQAFALPSTRKVLEGATLAEDSSSVNVTWPLQRVLLQNGVIIETIEGQEEFHTLSMGFAPELFELRDHPLEPFNPLNPLNPLILQYLNLVDIYAPCARDDCEADDSSGLKLLPAFFLWPIHFNRSKSLLFIDNCTMALPKRDFDGMLMLARAGNQWEKEGGPFAAYFSTFQVSSASDELVSIQTFTGSGVEGTHVNITRHPCDTTECQRHEARGISDIASIASTSLEKADADGREDGGGSGRASVLGPAIAVPVGVVLLSALGVVWFFLIHRRRSDAQPGATAEMSSSEDATQLRKHDGISPSTLSTYHNPLAAGVKNTLWHLPDEAPDRDSVRSSSELPGSGEQDSDLPPVEACLASHVAPGSLVSRGSYRIGSQAPSGRHLSMCLSLSSGKPPEAAPDKGQEQIPEDASEQQASPLREIQQLVRQLKADHLVIQRQLGQGGFGAVYQGLWRSLPVAVKIILFSSKPISPTSSNRGAQGDGEAAVLDEALHALGEERAVLEAAVTSAITHPNVVSTYHYDISEIKSEDVQGLRGLQVQASPSVKHYKLYLIQEFMEAGTLFDAIHRHRFFHSEDGLPFLDFVVQVLLDVAHGMAYVHSQSIIHGDLNPNNILLRVDMSKLSTVRAKVADFGACHLLQQGRLHVSNVQIGTPFYMDPLIRATGRSTSASDVFSFGVIMWEMYLGHAPYTQTPAGHYTQALDYPRYPPGAPKSYVDLSLQCLSFKPGKRPSFTHCVEVLKGLHEGFATQARQSQSVTKS